MDFSFFHRFWGDYFGTDEAPVEGKRWTKMILTEIIRIIKTFDSKGTVNLHD